MDPLTISQVELVKVVLLHNVARDEKGRHLLSEYKQGDPMVRVFEAELDARKFVRHGPKAVYLIADYVYAFANGHASDQTAEPLRQEYSARGLRDMNVGDVVLVSTLRMACSLADWKPVLHELNDITDQHEGESGTKPLLRGVT